MKNEQPAEWHAELDHKIHHHENMRLERVVRIVCTVDEEHEHDWKMGFREALEVVEIRLNADFLDDVAHHFKPPAKQPTGAHLERFLDEIHEVCEELVKEVRPKNLDELLELMRADPDHPYLTGEPDCVNDEWADLPVFSDRPWVGDTEAIWSWDDNRCIVGTDRDNLEIEPREKWDSVPPKT